MKDFRALPVASNTLLLLLTALMRFANATLDSLIHIQDQKDTFAVVHKQL